eukprot:3184597-Rhodomonas_salina.3
MGARARRQRQRVDHAPAHTRPDSAQLAQDQAACFGAPASSVLRQQWRWLAQYKHGTEATMTVSSAVHAATVGAQYSARATLAVSRAVHELQTSASGPKRPIARAVFEARGAVPGVAGMEEVRRSERADEEEECFVRGRCEARRRRPLPPSLPLPLSLLSLLSLLAPLALRPSEPLHTLFAHSLHPHLSCRLLCQRCCHICQHSRHEWQHRPLKRRRRQRKMAGSTTASSPRESQRRKPHNQLPLVAQCLSQYRRFVPGGSTLRHGSTYQYPGLVVAGA